jgi:hypothetical protein
MAQIDLIRDYFFCELLKDRLILAASGAAFDMWF